MSDHLTKGIIEILRDLTHSTPFYSEGIRYSILNKLTEIEKNANRPTGKHCIMNMTYEERKVAEKAIADYHAQGEYPVVSDEKEFLHED